MSNASGVDPFDEFVGSGHEEGRVPMRPGAGGSPPLLAPRRTTP
ncbi:MAG TPA: hypothetical protein VFI25_08890 [Planctomycetota bacterium]|nr:hypothetical protein [Planctomycetota bacterium]